MSETNESEESKLDKMIPASKKRKNYLILALSDKVDADTLSTITTYIKKQYPNLAVSTPKNKTELLRQLSRNISLLIIDDNFDGEIKNSLECVKLLKQKRSKEVTPVLFMTLQPQVLISEYHKILAPYHETDDLCAYNSSNISNVLERIKIGVDNKNRRRSRRYKVNLKVSFYFISKENEVLNGHFQDISVHGALLKSDSIQTFRQEDQLMLSVSISKLMKPSYGEFLRLPAKVKRVLISGDMVGINFEHLSEGQSLKLTELVTIIASDRKD